MEDYGQDGAGDKRLPHISALLLGDCKVGKTSIISQYLSRKCPVTYKQTVEPEFQMTNVRVGNTITKLKLWDSAGCEKFQPIGLAFYQEVDCCVLVVDVTNAESLRGLGDWRGEFVRQAAIADAATYPFVVLANKVDLESARVVSSQQIDAWCKANGGTNTIWCEASAKRPVEKVFQTIARHILKCKGIVE
eukprot:TRINITY_DN2609_c0_g1_i1.p1 TRINITY_DN2609_c0_g1~~TRINITY_DN2609_c0_g1_i1.p1  ORF type:complete len:218 (-),score=59.86 TRINITY_DN2609_c0_g1_i1:184-756(-)